MNKIKINYINLGGIGFTADSGIVEQRKTCVLQIVYELYGKRFEFEFNVQIIGVSDEDESGKCEYRAIYRNLSDSLLTSVKDVTENTVPSEISASVRQ